MAALVDRLRTLAEHRAAAWWVFAVALAFRLILGFTFLHPLQPPIGDGIIYDGLAKAIVERGEFGLIPGEPTAHRMPGYPLLLAAIKLAGGESAFAACMVQILVGASTATATFLLARLLVGAGPALVAGALAAIDPFLIFYDYQLWAECVGIALITWTLLHYARSYGRGAAATGWAPAVAGGLLLGVLIYIRPDFAILVPTVGTWALVSVRPLSRMVGVGLAAGVLPLVLLVPWIARNYAVMDHFIPLTTEGGYILWQANNEEILRNPELQGLFIPWPGNPQADYFTLPDLSKDPNFAGLTTEVEVDRRFKEIVLEFWHDHWREMPGYVLGKWKRFFTIHPGFHFWPKLFVVVTQIWYGAVLTFFVAGIAWSLVRRSPVGLLLSYLAWFFVRCGVFMTLVRYRLQVEPVLLIFAGVAAFGLLEALAGRRPKGSASTADAVR